MTCHNERAKTAGLSLDTADLADVPANAEVWEKVVRKVGAGMMPPPGRAASRRGARRRRWLRWLEAPLDRAAARVTPIPGGRSSTD